jgi:hypothetical protein
MSSIKINPLNVLGCREVSDPPLHFEYIHISLQYNIVTAIRDWIYENLKNRFYIGETLVLENNQFVTKIKIGFEEPRDASFFLLACSLLTHVKR